MGDIVGTEAVVTLPDCIICLEPLAFELAVTNCGHVYHGLCIRKWTTNRTTCPQCKSHLVESKLINLSFVATNIEESAAIDCNRTTDQVKSEIRSLEEEVAGKCKAQLEIARGLVIARAKVEKVKKQVDELRIACEEQRKKLKVVEHSCLRKQIAIREMRRELSVIQQTSNTQVPSSVLEAINRVKKTDAGLPPTWETARITQEYALSYKRHEITKRLREVVVVRDRLEKETIALGNIRSECRKQKQKLRGSIATGVSKEDYDYSNLRDHRDSAVMNSLVLKSKGILQQRRGKPLKSRGGGSFLSLRQENGKVNAFTNSCAAPATNSIAINGVSMEHPNLMHSDTTPGLQHSTAAARTRPPHNTAEAKSSHNNPGLERAKRRLKETIKQREKLEILKSAQSISLHEYKKRRLVPVPYAQQASQLSTATKQPRDSTTTQKPVSGNRSSLSQLWGQCSSSKIDGKPAEATTVRCEPALDSENKTQQSSLARADTRKHTRNKPMVPDTSKHNKVSEVSKRTVSTQLAKGSSSIISQRKGAKNKPQQRTTLLSGGWGKKVPRSDGGDECRYPKSNELPAPLLIDLCDEG